MLWPENYKITKSDEAAVVVSFTVDVNGNVKDAYISVPFYEPFNKEALRAIANGPKWRPAISHNRRVEDTWTQAAIFRQPKED
jgi:TonB family protein